MTDKDRTLLHEGTGDEIPEHLSGYVNGVKALVRELVRTQNRNARLRNEMAEMRRQLDSRKPTPDVAALERKVQHLRSSVERSKHRGVRAEAALAGLMSYIESGEPGEWGHRKVVFSETCPELKDAREVLEEGRA